MRFGKEKVMNRKNIMQSLKQTGGVWIFVIPALIPLIVFWIYPIFRSLFISFTDWDYMSPTYNFVFLDNFKSLFTDERFYEALWNTIVFSVGTIVPTIIGGLLLALLLEKNFKKSVLLHKMTFMRIIRIVCSS